MAEQNHLDRPVYQKIRNIARQIPKGRVATYGQIASFVERCTPRMVGYTMAGLPTDSDVPWQRVVNAAGRISPRGNFESSLRQRDLLDAEGVTFREDGSIDLEHYLWEGPDWGWLVENDMDPSLS